jgi:hypothetical protein
MTISNPQEEKTVWLLGAGASISDSNGHLPSLLGIPQKARDLGLFEPTAEEKRGLPQFLRYLKSRFYGDLSNPADSVNLEAVLTLLEIDIAVSGDPKLQFARQFVLRILRTTLLRLQKSLPGSTGEYRHFVEVLREHDTVITFNWDTLLDDAFGRESRLANLGTDNDAGPTIGQPKNHYDRFLLELTGWGERTIHGVPVPAPVHVLENRGYFIKAHGSIDWYYCTNPGCRAHEIVFPLLGSAKRPRCSGCRERTEVLIVPPTLNKRLRDVPITRRLWTLAASEVALATTIIVWGYSLPPTDFFSEWLLRHARSTRCKKLVLINPDVVIGAEQSTALNSAFIRRFIAALRPPRRKIGIEIFATYADYQAGDGVVGTDKRLRRELRRLSQNS